ncbi:MAG: SDR family NAD(P)-dependent oxidoreductase [bacterium]|nr:SDR family NAD(P)-dependent oxidoreductase [bacterium]
MAKGIFCERIERVNTVREMIDSFDEEQLDREAVNIKIEEEYTGVRYRELRDRVRALGNMLLVMGVQKGDTIGILSENRPEWAVVYLAVASIGAVIVPFDIFPESRELLPVIEAANIGIIFTSRQHREKLVPREPVIEKLRHVVCFEDAEDDTGLPGPLFYGSLLAEGKRLMEQGSDSYSGALVEPGDEAAFIHTHGNMFAVLTHEGIMGNANGIIERLSCSGQYLLPGEQWLAGLPFHHTYPVMFGLFIPLMTGGTVTMLSRFKTNDMLKTIKERGINYMATVPLVLEGIFEGISGEHDPGLDSIRFLITGGAPIDAAFLENIDKLGIPLLQGYGLTEFSPVVSVNNMRENRIGSIGRPLDEVSVMIRNPDDQGNGEILVKGPGQMKGYYALPEKTAEVLDPEGWLHTGDIGCIDSDGFLYITGRSKNIIVNKGGKNIYPEDIEQLLLKSEYISAVRVIPGVDNCNGEYPFAVIYPDPDAISPIESAEVRDLIEKEIVRVTRASAPYKMPGGFEITHSASQPLPPEPFMFADHYGERTPVKQMVSNQARDIYLGKIEDFLIRKAAAVSGVSVSELDAQERFLNFLDSAELVKISKDIENEIGIILHPALLFEYSTIRKLSGYLLEKQTDAIKQYFGHIDLNTGEEPEEINQPDKKIDKKPAPGTEIAIIGFSGIFPGSKTPEELWEHLEAGDDLISEIPPHRFDFRKYFGDPERELNKMNSKWGGFIDEVDLFDASFFNIAPREAQFMDPQQRIFLEVVWKTLEAANCKPSSLSGTGTGIFVGAATHDYTELCGRYSPVIDPYFATGSAHSMLANRISYLLDLRGSSEVIDTACSGSLVAIHRAVTALERGDCDMAIAGGVNVILSPTFFIAFSGAGMLSPDGRCKTFGKGANGYVRGEGAGALLLKPLSRAREDGNTICAVIKGIAVNHGGAASSLTAPNPDAQAQVLIRAYENAGISPATVSYIEAHGTGTQLGDPVEVQGLKKAFEVLNTRDTGEPARYNYCGLGSVKTNIGHLEAAAGVAGVIKVLLSFRHKRLPATLHCKELNPYIVPENSPFYITRDAGPWERGSNPRRAGISSFGFGGSNGHMVLEEYVDNDLDTNEPRTGAGEKEQLILLSAKNEDRLKACVQRMIEFLERNEPRGNGYLADIAYTLQRGREELNERLAIVVRDREQLLKKMREFVEEKEHVEDLYCSNIKTNKNNLVEGEAGKEFVRILIKNREHRKLALAWVSGVPVAWNEFQGSPGARWVSLPGYPFARERHWIEDSVRNENFFDPPGERPAVLHPLVERNTSNLSEQKFSTGLRGDEFFLTDYSEDEKLVVPGVVYIEMARAAGAIAGEMNVRRIKDLVWVKPLLFEENTGDIHVSLFLNRSLVGFEIFSCPGERDGERELHAVGKLEYDPYPESRVKAGAADIESIKRKCPHAKNSKETYEFFNTKGIQYGPAFQMIRELYYSGTEALSLLEFPDHLKSENFVLHPALMEGALQTCIIFRSNSGEESFWSYIPFALKDIEIIQAVPGRCYVHTRLVGERSLADYAVKIFSVRFLNEQGEEFVLINDFSIRFVRHIEGPEKNKEINKEEIKESQTHLFAAEWKKSELTHYPEKNISLGHVLVFDSDEIIWNELKERLGIRDEINTQFILVKPGNEYKHSGHQVYQVNPENGDDYVRLFETLKEKNFVPAKILHIWAAHTEDDDMDNSRLKIFEENENKMNDFIKKSLERGINSIFHIVKALSGTGNTTLNKFIFAFNGERTASNLFMEPVAAYSRSLNFIYPALSFSTIKVITSGKERSSYVDVVIQELGTERKEIAAEIRYIGDRRYSKQVGTPNMEDSGTLIKKKSVWLITGGAGALGLIFARYLAETYQAVLVLTGRSPLNSAKKEILENLNKNNSDVLYIQADAADRGEMRDVVEIIKKKYGTLNGVIHSAGTADDAIILRKDYAGFSRAMAPKIEGTIALDEATAGEALDFFIMFSSTASIVGDFGQCDYSVSNSFLDSFLSVREELCAKKIRHGKTIVINWPLWREGGMHLSKDAESLYLQSSGMSYLDTEEGLRVFEKITRSSCSRVIVFPGDRERINRFMGMEGSRKQRENNEKGSVTGFNPTTTEGIPLERRIQLDIQKIASALLKVDFGSMNDVQENLGNFGFDSITLKEFSRKLSDIYGVAVSPTVFFSHLTIGSLSVYLLNEFGDSMIDFYGAPNKEKLKPPAVEQEVPLSPVFKGISRGNLYRKEEIAIVGASGIFPGAENLALFWQNLESEKDLVSEVPPWRWDWRDYGEDPALHVKWGGFITGVEAFDAEFFNLSPREAELMDPQHRLFLQTAWAAIEDAGYNASELSGKAVGVFVGAQFNDYMQLLTEAGESKAYVSTGNTHSVLANRISYLLDFRGPSEAIDTACSSSLVAIHQAVKSIQYKESELAIAGGVSLILSPEVMMNVARLGILSPNGRCRTFDKNADGYVRGEGVGAILLKPLHRALHDHDHIYAVIKGTAVNHGGKASSLTAPNSDAQAQLLVTAYTDAGVDPAAITYIEAHGSGTELGDPIEVEGLKKAFRELETDYDSGLQGGNYCGLGSVKSNIGHLEPASGIAGLCKVILAMKNKKIPGNRNFKEINPYINIGDSPFYIVEKTIDWPCRENAHGKPLPRLAGVSSFGFGGTNAHIVLEEFSGTPAEQSGVETGEPLLFVLSAKNNERLHEAAKNLADYLNVLPEHEQGSSITLPDIAYTLQTGRQPMEERLACIASSREELLEKLRLFNREKIIENGYCGSVSEHKEKAAFLSNGTESEEFINILIDNKKFEKLAQIWLSGIEIDWKLLYPENLPNRVSLPTYPFAKELYWIPDHNSRGRGEKPGSAEKLHPLIHRNISTVTEVKFTTRLSGNEFYLRDHVVNGQKVLPGAAYIELARAAAEIAGERETRVLKNIVWAIPVTVIDTSVDLFINLYPEHDLVDYEMHTKGVDNERVIHSQGRVLTGVPAEEADPGFIDIAAIRKRCSSLREVDRFYELYRERGLDYGPAFQPIRELVCGPREALSFLVLPRLLVTDMSKFILHPTLIDGALQTIIGLEDTLAMEFDMEFNNTVYLPFSIGKIELVKSLVERCYAHVVLSERTAAGGMEVKKFNIRIADETGKILVTIDDFSVRAFQRDTGKTDETLESMKDAKVKEMLKRLESGDLTEEEVEKYLEALYG